MRILNPQPHLVSAHSSCSLNNGCGRSHSSAIGIKHTVAQLNLRTSNMILYRNTNIKLLRRSLYKSAPMPHMNILCGVKPHMTINAATTIPSAVRLQSIIHTHSNHIVASMQIACKLIAKRAVSIRSSTQSLTVNINSRVHVNAIEINIVMLAG